MANRKPRPTVAAPAAATAPPPERARSRSEERDALARAELAPLAPGERPTSLLVATGVCGVLAVAVLVGTLTKHDLSAHGGSLAGGLFLSGVLALCAVGMWHRRYYAVLGFEGLLAFQMLVSCIALTVVASLVVALALVLVVGLSGWLFWKLVRVMGRLSVTPREAAPGE